MNYISFSKEQNHFLSGISKANPISTRVIRLDIVYDPLFTRIK